jgi:hypothetical protein
MVEVSAEAYSKDNAAWKCAQEEQIFCVMWKT